MRPYGPLAYGYDPQNAPDPPDPEQSHEFRPVRPNAIVCKICRERWDHDVHLEDLD